MAKSLGGLAERNSRATKASFVAAAFRVLEFLESLGSIFKNLVSYSILGQAARYRKGTINDGTFPATEFRSHSRAGPARRKGYTIERGVSRRRGPAPVRFENHERSIIGQLY